MHIFRIHTPHPSLTPARASLLWLPLSLASLLLSAAIFMAGTSSCNTQGCTENRSALPLAAFYSSTTNAQIVLDSLEIWGVGAPNDSLLLHSGAGAVSLYLPFRFEKPSTSFCFHYAYAEQGLDIPQLNDTVTFHYTSTPYFASAECGAYYIYNIHRVDFTRHLIDTVAVLDSVISNVDLERIRIFFRTIETGGGETPDDPENEENEGSENIGDTESPDAPEAAAPTKERRIRP